MFPKHNVNNTNVDASHAHFDWLNLFSDVQVKKKVGNPNKMW
jgi:hypothetical protein